MGKRGTNWQLAAWFYEAGPNIFITGGAEQKALNLPAGRTLRVQSGRQDRGIVAKQRVTRVQKLRQIGKYLMRQRAVRPVDHQQARLIPLGRRSLGHQMGWQLVVEEIGGERHG